MGHVGGSSSAHSLESKFPRKPNILEHFKNLTAECCGHRIATLEPTTSESTASVKNTAPATLQAARAVRAESYC